MGEFTAISLLLMDINGITDFTKKSLQQYKMVVARTRHNSTQGFELYCGLSCAPRLASS